MAARNKPKQTKTKKRARKASSRSAAAGSAPIRLRPWRLPDGVRPTDVDVEVEVDPARDDRFEGEVRHTLQLARRRSRISLHAADLRLSRARVIVGDRTLRGRIVPRPEREAIDVELPESVPAGEVTLEIAFRGRLRGDLRGLYAAKDGNRPYAFTQLEAADARRFFPCFDEPSMKARFQISVTTARKHTVLSNQPVAKVEPISGRRKIVHFERTPPLSTYLLALAVGELEASKPTRCGPTEIRVWHAPGKGALTAFALETARETLARLEQYFDLPYPYAKLDLVAAPDFEAGAMENAGAVFFRETLLLLDPETATLAEKKRVAEVVCHELAHMWYGDLVTMAWWDDLWLNEAFATWMAFHVVDAWKPEWNMWNDFQHYRSAALGLDALDNTHPIYTTVRTPQEATENFDLITYEKGASVVRMIERYLGAGSFREGVRRYIRAHRESNAVASDLWRALEEASGQDVEGIVRPWIEQSGFPLVRLRRGTRKGEPVLRYRQERFGLRPDRDAGPERWPIPFVARTSRGGQRTATTKALLRAARGEIALGSREPRFVYGNADEGGFFRPLHDEAELRNLANGLASLGAVERMGLVGHQWAATRAGKAKLGSFLDLALAFGDETDPDVLLTLRAPLAAAAELAARRLGDEEAAVVRERVGEVFGPAFHEMGFDAGRHESDDQRMRRSALLALAGGVAELPEVVAEARERAAAYLRDRRALEPNLADTAVSLAASAGDAKLFDAFLAASEGSATPQERRRFLMSLADFREPELAARTQALLLDERVGTQDVALLLTRLLANRDARVSTWSLMKRRWPALRRRMPPMLVTRPIEALPGLGTRAYRREVAAFFRAHPVATGARAVKQSLERFDLNLAFDERAAPDLRRWLG